MIIKIPNEKSPNRNIEHDLYRFLEEHNVNAEYDVYFNQYILLSEVEEVKNIFESSFSSKYNNLSKVIELFNYKREKYKFNKKYQIDPSTYVSGCVKFTIHNKKGEYIKLFKVALPPYNNHSFEEEYQLSKDLIKIIKSDDEYMSLEEFIYHYKNNSIVDDSNFTSVDRTKDLEAING